MRKNGEACMECKISLSFIHSPSHSAHCENATMHNFYALYLRECVWAIPHMQTGKSHTQAAVLSFVVARKQNVEKSDSCHKRDKLKKKNELNRTKLKCNGRKFIEKWFLL